MVSEVEPAGEVVVVVESVLEVVVVVCVEPGEEVVEVSLVVVGVEGVVVSEDEFVV